MNEQIKPDYYKFTIKGVEFDVIDIAKAMELPFTLSLALKYFRVKGDLKKIISEKIQSDFGEKGSIFNASGEYFNKKSDTYKKYKEDNHVDWSVITDTFNVWVWSEERKN